MGEKVKKYFDKVSREYTTKSSKGLWSFIRNRELKVVKEALEFKNGSNLLDLGAGSGFYSSYFKIEYSANVTAVENSQLMISELKKKDINFIDKDLDLVDQLPEHEFILAAGVLEFLMNPDFLFEKISKALTLNGRFVVLIPTSGISGVLYKIIHYIWDCPVFVRSTEEYLKIARDNKMKLLITKKATPMSRVLVFIHDH